MHSTHVYAVDTETKGEGERGGATSDPVRYNREAASSLPPEYSNYLNHFKTL